MYVNKATRIKLANEVMTIKIKTKTFGDMARVYMRKYTKTHKAFCEMVDKVAKLEGECFTENDLNNYLYKGINPKANKLAAVIKATGMPEEFWTGAISWPTNK